MKNITECLTESSDKDFNKVRRIGVLQQMLVYLDKSGKLSKSQRDLLSAEIRKFPIPDHLINDDFHKQFD